MGTRNHRILLVEHQVQLLDGLLAPTPAQAKRGSSYGLDAPSSSALYEAAASREPLWQWLGGVRWFRGPPSPYLPVPLYRRGFSLPARENSTPPWTARDLRRGVSITSCHSPSIPAGLSLEVHAVLAPSEHQGRQLAKLLHGVHRLRKDV